jgi:hypothetical protein
MSLDALHSDNAQLRKPGFHARGDAGFTGANPSRAGFRPPSAMLGHDSPSSGGNPGEWVGEAGPSSVNLIEELSCRYLIKHPRSPRTTIHATKTRSPVRSMEESSSSSVLPVLLVEWVLLRRACPQPGPGHRSVRQGRSVSTHRDEGDGWRNTLRVSHAVRPT